MKKQVKEIPGSSASSIAEICLSTIIDNTRAPVFFLDCNYRYISYNRTHASVMKALYGTKVERGASFLDCMTVEEDRETARENIDKALEQGIRFVARGYSGEEKLSRRYFEITHSPVKDSKGFIIGVAVAARDISGQKKADEVISASRTRYRELFNHISSAVAVYEAVKNGRDFIIRDFNRAACKTEKLRAREVIGKSVIEVFPGVKDFGIFKVFQRVWKTGRPERFPIAQYHDERISGWRDNYIYRLPSGEIVAVYDDVTAQKKTLEELEITNERLNLALDGADLGFYDLNLVEDTFYGDPRYFNLIGYAENDLQMNVATWKSLIHPDDLETNYDSLLKHMKSRDTGILEGEYRMRHKLGHWVWILDRARIVGWDKEGNPTRLAGTHLDITSRKLAELALLKSEERYRNIFENAIEGIFQSTPEGRYITVNPAFAQMAGYDSPEEMITSIKNIGSELYIHPEERHRIIELFNDPGYVRDHIAEIRRKDGSVLWVSINARAVKDENGQILYYEGTTEDITVRKQAQVSIERQREEYRTIFDSVPAFIAYMDKSGNFLRVNRPAASSLGLSPKETIGKSYFDVYPAEVAAAFHAIFLQVFSSGVPVTGFVTKYTTLKGETHWSQNDIVPYYDSHGEIIGTILFGENITERKKAEMELELSYKALRKSLEGAVSAMAKIVEMKDPYTAGHQARVAELSVAIAMELKLSEERISHIQTAARLHDIGKIYVPSDILSKPGNLTKIEFEIIKTHAQGSYDILKSIDFPGPVAKIALQHHERLNGSGYPHGITGDEIIQEARILAVADVVEAMISYRPYRPSLGIDRALEEITRGKDTLYDALAVGACTALFQEKNFTFETPRTF